MVMRDYVRVYRGEDGDWHWQRKAPNGQIVAVSGEGFVNREYAEHSAQEYNEGIEMHVDSDLTGDEALGE